MPLSIGLVVESSVLCRRCSELFEGPNKQVAWGVIAIKQ